MRLFASATSLDGAMSYRVEATGDASDPEVLGKSAYLELATQGAGPLFEARR